MIYPNESFVYYTSEGDIVHPYCTVHHLTTILLRVMFSKYFSKLYRVSSQSRKNGWYCSYGN